MVNIKPITRLTVGLACMTISILLFAQIFGLVPDERKAFFDARKKFAQSLAVHFAHAAKINELSIVESTLHFLKKRNPDIISLGVRKPNGKMLVQIGDHDRLWKAPPKNMSTLTHIVLPIYNGRQKWGDVELHFKQFPRTHFLGLSADSILVFYLFVALACLFLFYIILKRTLKHLDPSSVIPQRVKSAMNVLAEGVLIIDNNQKILLANRSFAKKVQYVQSDLFAKKINHLNWHKPEGGDDAQDEFPWEIALNTKKSQTSIPISFEKQNGEKLAFMVNSTPIIDDDKKMRGVIATFDDVSQLEKKNGELKEMLGLLKKSEAEVKQKNVELGVLATQDPLTSCLNRRAFLELFETTFTQENDDLACLMVDIDKFKNINDQYGHQMGDVVISDTAKTLRRLISKEDAICRYGGEEFCLFIKSSNLDEVKEIAEKMRGSIENLKFENEQEEVSVSISLGLSFISFGANSVHDLIKFADEALYIAKETGRNQVVVWDSEKSQQRREGGNG